MIETSERIIIDVLKDEWISLKQTFVDGKVINGILDHKIMPHVSGYGVKESLGNRPIKCKAYLNKITRGYGCELNSSFKNIIPCNTLHVELRD